MAVKVIIGPNGCGKTQRVETEYRFNRKLNFRDSYGLSDGGYYLQQRWNSCEYDLVPTVRETLEIYDDETLKTDLLERFGIAPMIDKEVILLSSGELRKLQLTKALLTHPKRLILDNPFIGLDTPTREQLNKVMQDISANDGVELVLVLSREGDIPEYADEVERMEKADCEAVTEGCSGDKVSGTGVCCPSVEEACRMVVSLGDVNPDFSEVVRLNDVCISYGDRTILKGLDWIIKTGEKWALQGRNGSGKSTLLSIICADVPQAYACDVTLFGRRRGTGETIWDIKRNIGYVSPELHRAYNHDVPVLDVVASGTHDRYGMYVQTSEEHIPDCEFWMKVFGILHLRDRSFLKISSGEQRLVLLARAFVKDPPLMILDEPLHGLDDTNRERVMAIIDAFASRKGKTMIMVSHYDEDFPSCINRRKTMQRN